MTEQELSRLEAEFHVTLPAVYRRTMIEFPVAELKGNNHTYFWNNARSLSQLNKLVRVDGFIPHGSWPPQMFAIGRADGDDVVSAIDVRDPEAPVWTFQMDLLTAGPPHELEKRFTDFVRKFVDFAPQLLKGRSSRKTKAASGTVVPSWRGRALTWAFVVAAVLLAWLLLRA